MPYTGLVSLMRSLLVLAKDCVYPQEPLNFPIHYTRGMRLLLLIQRWRCWRLSATCCTHYSEYLFTWRRGQGGQVHFPHGFLVGVIAWRHCQARSGSGGYSFTAISWILHGVFRKNDALFGVQVEECFRGFVVAGFFLLPSPLKSKACLYQAAALRSSTSYQ